MAFDDFIDPVTGDILLGIYRIPTDVWNSIYSNVIDYGHVDYPFEEDSECWRFAFYLGICACESGFQDLEGDPAVDKYSGTAQTCCTYWICLDDIVCSTDPYKTAWDIAVEHAPYGDQGAYLSHGWYQIYVCGQGTAFACQPSELHVLGVHMSIALPHIENAINSYWDADNIEQSVRTCAQASGHPGWVGDYDYRVTNIWDATVNIQPDLCAFLGGAPGPGPGPGPSPVDPSPLPPIPEQQQMGDWPLPALPTTTDIAGPMPEFPPMVATGGWAMPPFLAPMFSDDYELGQRFDEAYITYNCAGSDCGYGRMQPDGGGHRGVDLEADEGKPVFPVAGSVDPSAPSGWYAQVVAVVKDRQGTDSWSLGNYVILRHVPIMYANMVDSCYAHLQYGSIPDAVHVGAWLSVNFQIGRVGNTGLSHGPHLHFEIRYADATGMCNGKICWLEGEPLTAAEFEPCCKMYDPELLVPFS